MSGVVDFLNANAGAFNAIFSGVVALATVLYAVLTWRLVMETAALRRAQTDPFVVVYVGQNQQAFGFLDLVIINDGLGPAYDVRFKISECTLPDVLQRLEGIGFIKRGFTYMPAKQEIRTFLTEALSPEKADARLVVSVEYRTPAGQDRLHEYPLELALLQNVLRLGTPFHQRVPELLKSIDEHLEQLVRAASKQ